MDWTKAFATSDTTKVFLDPGRQFWILVRNELSHAEQRAVQLGAFRRLYREDEQFVELDPKAAAGAKVLAYLVDWNLVGKDDKTIDIGTAEQKRDAVKNLKPEHYAAIEAKIDEHVEALSKKKAQSGGMPSSATSGPLDGSASVG